MLHRKLLVVSALLLGSTAQFSAQAMTAQEHKAGKDRIEAEYKAQKAQCDTLKDNAEDVCEKQAEAKEKDAKAALEQQYQPSARNARKVDETRAEGAYEVAKEKCDDQSGNAKDACTAQAKADHEKAKASIEAKAY